MILVISHTTPIPGEADLLQAMLAAGADRVLLRKPGWTQQAYEQLLGQLPPAYYPMILLSGYPELCIRTGLGGLHCSEQLRASLPAAALQTLRAQGLLLSTGVHAPGLLDTLPNEWQQVLLSPVFDSISKPGYKGSLSGDWQLPRTPAGRQVLALGGIDIHTVAAARRMRFDGIALMGALWRQPEQAVTVFTAIHQQWNNKDHTY
ncbi:thiamine phosphate synthase [Chitinophaga pendula]|uniref:thiamine phosphate synthase n=1 Tax=Chitinophaga TaxID=79328 RepID=UPI000BAED172|nr:MULTISPECIES: thiamine phosphate synthase [Chitinophaga]ASZ10252.1 hypothetical protein CK934_04285 [Chitinophaga sp. MD30]UCJ06788.1 thiamine phosphate synthase [Chitinophaga pendula]